MAAWQAAASAAPVKRCTVRPKGCGAVEPSVTLWLSCKLPWLDLELCRQHARHTGAARLLKFWQVTPVPCCSSHCGTGSTLVLPSFLHSSRHFKAWRRGSAVHSICRLTAQQCGVRQSRLQSPGHHSIDHPAVETCSACSCRPQPVQCTRLPLVSALWRLPHR